jgi:hypothetical protein
LLLLVAFPAAFGKDKGISLARFEAAENAEKEKAILGLYLKGF